MTNNRARTLLSDLKAEGRVLATLPGSASYPQKGLTGCEHLPVRP